MILMDIQMPEMNGFEATEAIRKLDKQKGSIPIIAVTANSLKGINARYNNCGMTDYLIKPYNEENLFTVMDKIINKTSNSASQNQNTESVTKKKISVAENLAIMSGGNELYAKKLAEIFVRTSPEILTLMKEAMLNKDWETLGKQAHKFISSIGALGIEEGTTLVRKIEDNAKQKINFDTIESDLISFENLLEDTIYQLKTEFL